MFKDKLIDLRKQNNDTQESLSKKINVSRSLVAKWEQNRAYPTNEDLENIAKVYNVTYEDLMSEKELKDIYGILSKNSKKKNLLIMILSIIFSLSTILLVIINFIPITKYINMEKDEVTTQLRQYIENVNGEEKVSVFRGESEQNNFMRNENLYTWEYFQMDKIEFTDVSSLYILHYMPSFTPGEMAYANGYKEFDKNAFLEDVSVNIKFNDYTYVNPIFGWPNVNMTHKEFKSRYSDNILLNQEYNKFNISLKNINGNMVLNYDDSDDLLNIFMSPGYSEKWKEFEYQDYTWYFTMLNYYSKWATFHGYFYLIFEVNEKETNEFSFDVNKKVTTKSKNRFTVTYHTTTYNCIM